MMEKQRRFYVEVWRTVSRQSGFCTRNLRMIGDLTKHSRCRYAVLELYSAGFCWVPPPSLHFISAAATVKVNGPTVESVLVLTSSPDNTFFSPLKYGVIHPPYVIFNALDKRFHHKGGLFTGSFEEAHPRVGKFLRVNSGICELRLAV